MAESDKVKSSDIIQPDIYANTIKSTEDLIKVLDKLEKQFKVNLTEQEKLLKSKGNVKDAKDIQDVNNALKESAKSRKVISDVEKEQLKLKQKLKSLSDEEVRGKLRFNAAAKAQRDILKDEIILQDKQAGTLVKLNAENRKLRREREGLNLETTKGKARLTEINKVLDANNAKIDANSDKLKRQKINIGNYSSALSKAKGVLVGFAGALGITAGLTGLVNAFKKSINIAKEFEQGNANLASVLGKTKDEIGALTEDAKRLGAATSFSATQVSRLQTEFAKLGFNEQEILNATEATLNLAAATGSDLGNAAAIAGATLGGFGLGAEETQRVVDVMAKSFSTSALDLEKFKESMKLAAPAARAVGVSVEETTALLGTLSNAGISGSNAGTALRGSFINLNKAGLTLQEGLDKVKNSQDKLGTATKLVGKLAATSFLILAEGTETTKALTLGLNNAGGAAEKMAKEQLNTLQGRITILGSAWEGFVLSLLSGDSAFNSIAYSVVEAATSLLGFLTASEDVSKVSFETAKALRAEANESENLLNEYESLVKDGVTPTKEEKERLDIITLQLKDHLGDSVVAINEETGAFELNTEAVREQIKLKRFASDQEAATLASRLKGVQDEIKLQESKTLGNKKEQEQRAEIQRLAREKLNALEIEERFNLTASENLKQARIEEETAQKNFINFAKQRTETSLGLIKNREEEANLIAKLKELNFTAADAEALFTEKKKEGTKAILEKIDATNADIEAKKELLKIERESIKSLPVDERTKAEQEFTKEFEKLTNQQNEILLKKRDIEKKSLQENEENLAKEIELEESRKSIQDARLSTSKDLSNLTQLLAGEDEDAQRAILATQKALALSEIAINLQKTISGIREKNANKENEKSLNTSQITSAYASAALGTATVLKQSFFDGTENTGNGGKADDRGGFNAILHPFERVMTAQQNSKVGELSNNELADIALMYNRGHLVNPFTDMAINVTSKQDKQVDKTYLLVNEIKDLKDIISNKPVQQVNVDSFGNLVEVVYQKSVKDTYIHKSKKWL